MFRFRLAVSFFLSCFLSLSLAAQQSTQQGPLLLQRSLAAMTGGAALSDVTLTGSVRRIAGSNDETGTATLKALATGENRVDLSFASGLRSEVRANSDVGPAGQWSGPDGAAHAIANHNLMAGDSWFFLPFTLSGILSQQDSVITDRGQEAFDGVSVEHISIYSQFSSLQADASMIALVQRLSQMELYLDSSSILPVALTFNTHPDDNALLDIPVIVRYSNFQPVNGTQIAFHVQKFINNTLVLDLQFQSPNFNTGLSATDFNLASSSPPGPSNVLAASHFPSAVKP